MKRLAILGILALAACSAPPPVDPAAERAELIAERVAFKERTAAFDIDKFDCPAKTVSDDTAEKMLLLWVNDRPDLVDRGTLETVSNDFVAAFVACGASEPQVANELHQSDDAMLQGLVMAILQQGRGLS